jgi:regulator of protease activity HflC (stomatin/prohibitin superfamily)
MFIMSFLTIAIICVIILFFFGFCTVEQNTVAIVEVFGKFNRILPAGLQFRIPFIEQIRERITLRQQNFALEGNYPSQDKVIVTISTNLIFSVYPTEEGMKRFVYALSDRKGSIAAVVENSLRTYIAKETHEGILEKKEELASHIKTDVLDQFGQWGMDLVSFQITNVTFPKTITDAMSEVVASEQLRKAAQNKGEAAKIQAIKEAEGEKERKRLQGEGIALEREAIAEGLRSSIEIMKSATGHNSKEILATLSLTQYLDTLKQIGSTENTKVIFLDTNVEKTTSILQQLISSQEMK